MSDTFYDRYLATLASLHNRRLTTAEWQAFASLTHGLTVKDISSELGRAHSSVRETIGRANDRVFTNAGIVPTPAVIGAWFALHYVCCRPDEIR